MNNEIQKIKIIKKVKVSVWNILKLCNCAHKDFGVFAGFLWGLADKENQTIEIDVVEKILDESESLRVMKEL